MYESFSYFKKIITKKLFSLSHTGYTIFNFELYGLKYIAEISPLSYGRLRMTRYP